MPLAPAEFGWRHTKAKLAIKQAVPASNPRGRKRKIYTWSPDGLVRRQSYHYILCVLGSVSGGRKGRKERRKQPHCSVRHFRHLRHSAGGSDNGKRLFFQAISSFLNCPHTAFACGCFFCGTSSRRTVFLATRSEFGGFLPLTSAWCSSPFSALWEQYL